MSELPDNITFRSLSSSLFRKDTRAVYNTSTQEQSAGGKETPAIEMGRDRTTHGSSEQELRTTPPVGDGNDALGIGVIAEVNLLQA